MPLHTTLGKGWLNMCMCTQTHTHTHTHTHTQASISLHVFCWLACTLTEGIQVLWLRGCVFRCEVWCTVPFFWFQLVCGCLCICSCIFCSRVYIGCVLSCIHVIRKRYLLWLCYHLFPSKTFILISLSLPFPFSISLMHSFLLLLACCTVEVELVLCELLLLLMWTAGRVLLYTPQHLLCLCGHWLSIPTLLQLLVGYCVTCCCQSERLRKGESMWGRERESEEGEWEREIEREGQRQRHRERQTERDTDRQRETGRKGERQKCIHTNDVHWGCFFLSLSWWPSDHSVLVYLLCAPL